MPRRGGACPAARSGARAPGIAGATRPRRLCLRSRHRCGCLGSDGAPFRPGDDAVSFARPLLLAALLALPFWWWLRARRLGRLRGTRMSDVRPSAGAGERLWVARLPVTLRSLCLAAWIVAAAGPRVGAARAETRSEGISIVLAIDLSSSMLSEDFAPANRIDVAKQTAIEFVRERRTDVIVLLTDGVNNRGTVDPRTAAQAAATLGIRIYVIGVGTRGEAPVPTGQGLEGLRYQMMPVEIDEPLMTEIARMTGGRYFRATDTQSLRHVFDEINRLEKSTVEQVVYRRFEEAYRVPLALGLVALGLEIVLAATLAVRVP